jgi:hypothetical protein
MVRIDRVVTRGGDAGETSLGDGARVRKDSARIAAIGAVDETNAAIGVLRLHTSGTHDAMLARIQNDLFDVGADMCVPGEAGERLRERDAGIAAGGGGRGDERNLASADQFYPAGRFGGRGACSYSASNGAAGRARHRGHGRGFESGAAALSQSAVGPFVCAGPRVEREWRGRCALDARCEQVSGLSACALDNEARGGGGVS